MVYLTRVNFAFPGKMTAIKNYYEFVLFTVFYFYLNGKQVKRITPDEN